MLPLLCSCLSRPAHTRHRATVLVAAFCALLALGSCSPRISLFPGGEDPLKESVLSGAGPDKVLVISLQGLISDAPDKGVLRTRPSLVQEVVSRLYKAEKDEAVKAVVLKINSPGGTVTASDILYQEIREFKNRSDSKVVACMLDVAASGGYYAAMAADHILAHPTTLTGSVGVVFVTPHAPELMDMVGVSVEVTKSGTYKDMNSPFRNSTARERAIMQNIVDSMAQRFYSVVQQNRRLSPDALEEARSARVFTGEEALKLGLVDETGYLTDAIGRARELAGLPDDARVIAYRRSEYPDDSPYNEAEAESGKNPPLVGLGLERFLDSPEAGLYYLWLP